MSVKISLRLFSVLGWERAGRDAFSAAER